jgi:hypothetical protein
MGVPSKMRVGNVWFGLISLYSSVCCSSLRRLTGMILCSRPLRLRASLVFRRLCQCACSERVEKKDKEREGE